MKAKLVVDVHVKAGDFRAAVTAARQLAGRLDVTVRLIYGIRTVEIDSIADIEDVVSWLSDPDQYGRIPTS